MMNNTEAQANEIINQLGGRRIFAMAFSAAHCDRDSSGRTYIRLFIAGALTPHVPGKANQVMVTLEHDDTYRVNLLRAKRDGHAAKIDQAAPVYCDNLRETVERMTGLRLSL